MPKRVIELTALAVRRLQTRGMHAVGGVAGLYLRISETGNKYWVWRGNVNGRRRDLGIGPFPEVSLARARQDAAELREAVRSGKDPVQERQIAKATQQADSERAMTFDECLEGYLSQKIAEFKNPKHARQWRTSVERYVSPHIGTLAVDQISFRHVVDTLYPIWTRVPETASRVRGRVEKVLDFATVCGYRDGANPARWRGNLDAVLPATSKIRPVRHHRTIAWADAPAFMDSLRTRRGISARALQFLLLTGTRSGEVRGATWDEIDTKGATWTIPGERMKAGNAHVVPLSQAVLALLKTAPTPRTR